MHKRKFVIHVAAIFRVLGKLIQDYAEKLSDQGCQHMLVTLFTELPSSSYLNLPEKTPSSLKDY